MGKNMQEHEIEYVEGYEGLEEEDDIEDFGGLAIGKSHMDVNNGKPFLIAVICSFIELLG